LSLNDTYNPGRLTLGGSEHPVPLLDIPNPLEATIGHGHHAVPVEAGIGGSVIDRHRGHRFGGSMVGAGLDCGLGGWELAEDLIDLIPEGLEEWAPIVLDPRVLEVVALLEEMGTCKGREVVDTPLLEEVGLGEGLCHLTLQVLQETQSLGVLGTHCNAGLQLLDKFLDEGPGLSLSHLP